MPDDGDPAMKRREGEREGGREGGGIERMGVRNRKSKWRQKGRWVGERGGQLLGDSLAEDY